MSTKDFKAGMVAGAKPFGDKLDQLANVSESAVMEIKEGQQSTNEIVGIVLDNLSAQEKKRIYDLDETMDVSSLDDDEKEFLIAVLTELANEIPCVSDLQKKYLLSICSVANISAPQTVLNLASIENVENMKTQKILLKHVMEFFFIGEQKYDFLDTYESTVFCYFSVNKRGVSDIKDSIDRVFNAMGVEGIASKYTFTAGYEELIEQCNTEEYSDTEMFAYGSDEWIPADETEYEETLISELIHIGADETKIYKYKKIIIESIINVDGFLFFEDCVVQLYNEDAVAYFSVKGNLEFKNCKIICKTDNTKHLDDSKETLGRGVINGSDTADITFSNCIICEAGHFISTEGETKIDNCTIHNPGIRFISVIPKNGNIISNCYFDFENKLLLGKTSKVIREIILTIKNEDVDNQNNFVIENSRFVADDEAHEGVILVDSSNNAIRIVNCEMIGFKKAAATIFGSIIENTYFENCRGIYSNIISGSYFENSSYICSKENAVVENCDFEGCKMITLPKNSVMKNCRVLNSKGRILEAENSKVVECIFSNIRKWNKGVVTNNVWGEDSEKNYPIYFLNSKAESCIFDGIELKDNAFLIVGEQLKECDIPFSVEKCVFRNCYTDRTDKKILIGREHYGIFATRTRETDPVKNCIGLDKVVCGELSADVPIAESKNYYGVAAGAIVGAVLAGNIGAAFVGAIGAVIDSK